MKWLKLRFGGLKGVVHEPRRGRQRPQLELLEDRLQPALVGLALAGVAGHPLGGFYHLDFVAQSTSCVPHGFIPMLTLNTATYITGTTGSATARGLALGNDGSTYETGTINQNGSAEGYLAKYDSSGKQVYLFTFQAINEAVLPNIQFMNTEGHAVAVDSFGNSYVAGTAIDPSSGAHNAYTVKISADGTAIVWGVALSGPHNVTSGDGIAVNDPNQDGNGLAVMTGTYTITDPNIGPVGDHLYLVRWSPDGGSFDYDTYLTITFPDGTADRGTHGKAVALNSSSTARPAGSVAYVAGNIVHQGDQQTLAVQFDNGSDPTSAGNVNWANFLVDPGAKSDTLTGVAVKANDSSVFSGTVVSGSSTVGLVISYPADGGQGHTLFQVELQRALAFYAVAVDGVGNIYVTGAAADPSSGRVYVAALDSMGSFLSRLLFGDTGSVDAGYGIVAAGSGSLWVVGDTTSAALSTDGTTLNGTQDGFLVSATP